MRIRRRLIDNDIEKKIAVGFIISDTFCKEMERVYGNTIEGIFNLPSLNVVQKWCMEHYRKYKKAPGKEIEDVFKKKSKKLQDKDSVRNFLQDLSGEYEKGQDGLNAVYLIDKAKEHILTLSAELAIESMRACIDENNPGKVIDIMASFVKGRSANDSSDMLDAFDLDSIHQYFNVDRKMNQLYSMSGISDLIGPFERGWLLSIMAPMGRGKSWFMQEVGFTALENNLKVLFISLEMSKSQLQERFIQRLTGMGMEDTENSYTVLDCLWNQNGSCKRSERTNSKSLISVGKDEIMEKMRKDSSALDNLIPMSLKKAFTEKIEGYKPCLACKDLDLGFYKGFMPSYWKEFVQIKKVNEEIAKGKMKIFKKLFPRACMATKAYPPNSVYASDVLYDTIIKFEMQYGVTPDIVITDYADRFAIEKKFGGEVRHGLDDIWKTHKEIAEEFKCLVVTGTQTNRKGIEKKGGLSEVDIAEDIRKMAICDVVIGMNQSKEQKTWEVAYYNLIKHRHLRSDIKQKLMAISMLDIAHPLLFTYKHPF